VAEENSNSSSNKKIDISFLMKQALIPINTSQGVLYVRHLSDGDLKKFSGVFNEKKDKNETNLKALGEFAVKILVSTDDGFEDTSELTEDDFSQLNEYDIRSLVEGIIKASNLPALSGGEILQDLGSLIFDWLLDQIKRVRETNEKMKNTLNSAFGSISHGAMKSLQDSMSSLNAVRDSLKLSPAVEAFKKIQEDQERMFGGISSKDLLAQVNILDIPKPRMPELYMPKFEETPIGRAAIASEDSAIQLREVAGLVGDMADRLAALHTVFLTEIIPQWVDSLEKNSGTINTSLSQTEKSLFWAKWALIASVFVTIAMTGWQIWIASDYKLDNDKQQSVSLSIMEAQLKASQDLNKQLMTNSIQLKEDLSNLQKSVETLKAAKATSSKQTNK